MLPYLTRTTTVRPAEEPRLPRANYRAPISRGPEHLTTHITHHFRRPSSTTAPRKQPSWDLDLHEPGVSSTSVAGRFVTSRDKEAAEKLIGLKGTG